MLVGRHILTLLFLILVSSDLIAGDKKDKPKFTNRLAKETSPYLLMHSHNPTDWYAWGPEAFAKAKKENKLIFLSIGYSSRFWCHVMERESFNNEAVAKILNANFVCIKVDREERPDIDQIYMTALNVQGARRLAVVDVLMPDGRPSSAARIGRPMTKIEGETGSASRQCSKPFRTPIRKTQGNSRSKPRRSPPTRRAHWKTPSSPGSRSWISIASSSTKSSKI